MLVGAATVLDEADHPHLHLRGLLDLEVLDRTVVEDQKDQADLVGQRGLEGLADQLVAEQTALDDSATAEEGPVAGQDDLENRRQHLHEKEGLLVDQVGRAVRKENIESD